MKVIINALHRATRPTGVCRYAFNLAIDISSLRNVEEVVLVVGKWQEHYFHSSFNISTDKIKIFVVDIKNNALSRNCWFLFGLPNLVKRLRGDLLHLSFPIPIISNWITIPTYVTIHDLYPYEIPENFGFPRVYFNRLFLYMSIKSIENIICVSNTTKKGLNYYFPNECRNKKISVVYNTVKFSDINEVEPKFISDYNSSSFFLCNSQHRKNKNIPLILKAFSSLLLSRKIDSRTRLVIVGSKGPETKRISQLLWDYRIDKNTILVDSITDSELAWLYKNCKLFIAASNREGFCIPLAEALLFSANIICSNIPIFKEIGDNSFTYFDLDENASHNLAMAIEKSINFKVIERVVVPDRVSKNRNRKSFLSSADKYGELYKQNLVNISS